MIVPSFCLYLTSVGQILLSAKSNKSAFIEWAMHLTELACRHLLSTTCAHPCYSLWYSVREDRNYGVKYNTIKRSSTWSAFWRMKMKLRMLGCEPPVCCLWAYPEGHELKSSAVFFGSCLIMRYIYTLWSEGILKFSIAVYSYFWMVFICKLCVLAYWSKN